MRTLSLFFSLVILSACTAIQQKGEHYRNVGEMIVNPEKIRIVYERDGGESSFLETRCSGKLCDSKE